MRPDLRQRRQSTILLCGLDIMKTFIKQISALLGTVFAAVCCLGLPLALSVLGEVFGPQAEEGDPAAS